MASTHHANKSMQTSAGLRSIPVLLILLVALRAGAEETPTVLDETVVSGSREATPLAETAASVGSIKGETLRADKPSHPADVLGQVPGVYISVTNGEGHQTAIRQPITTNPVYLYLEDGVPVRSTGFFNHNALYEINIPQSGGVEITRGPGSALYGSDAIGGVINVLSRTPPASAEASASAEVGGWGWWRLLAGGGDSYRDDAWRTDLNLTHTDSWRDATGYDRQSVTARWDHGFDADAVAKTMLAYSHIDQQTGANSPLVYADYRNDPTKNYYAIAYRKVEALRLSSAFERESGDTLISVIPYVRDDSMELLPSFTLNSDPQLYTSANQSIGLLSKWRKDYAPLRTRLIAGLDLDYSPGGRVENNLSVTSTGSGAARVFTSYTVGPRTYDYDVSYLGVSPYVQAETSPSERLRVTAGLRYDWMRYAYDNKLSDDVIQVGSNYYGHVADTDVDFRHASPKLGATYALNTHNSLFAAWANGFRAPSESQLFRPTLATTNTTPPITPAQATAAAQANAQSALGLQPVNANQIEIGARGQSLGMDYSLSLYYLSKHNDIVTYKDPTTNISSATNAGETLHRGVEVGLGFPLGSAFRFDAAFSYARHTYEEWIVSPTINYSGNDMEFAPRWIGNTRLSWLAAPGTRVQLEWISLGPYWMNPTNTIEYEGYSLINLRANWSITQQLALFGSVHNLVDVRYADSASITSNTPVYSPGLPRTLYAGVEYRWGGTHQTAPETQP
jgi:iron complex outermembrane receptor protein